jgi:hypothetical protein
MRITKKFISLTKLTYPHGTESGLIDRLPQGFKRDGHGNFYLEVGKGSNTMFTCHLDTADRKQTRVKHVFEGDFVKTDGKSILGADDKAGMTIISYMISRGIPGIYFFFIGEEVGCVGSKKLADNWEKSEFSKRVNKVVSFDRRGTDSIITHQMFGRCCSEEFANELSHRLNQTGMCLKMRPDDTGILTDSAQFTDLVPECTNISVGYYNEHTFKEMQDMGFLRRIAQAACLVDWETLPIKRNPDDIDEEDFYYTRKEKAKSKDESWSEDNWSHFLIDGVIKKMYICQSQIDEEKKSIWKWICDRNEDVIEINWNGRALYTKDFSGTMRFVSDRVDLMESVPDLGSVYVDKISEKISKGILDRIMSIL